MSVADTTRRRFLEASASAAVGTWLASRMSSRSWAAPPGGETPLGTVPFVGEGRFPLETTMGDGLGRRRALDLATLAPAALVTPTDRFFIRTGRPDRLPPPDRWKVRLHGLVRAPAEIPVSELVREAAPVGVHLLECAGNSRRAHFGLMSAASWTGISLERVLKRVAPRPGATRVLVSGFDAHSTSDPGSVPGASWIFSLDQVRESGAFLATGMNGAPLTPDHGYPVRLVVPGWYGCAAIKWVDEIALLDDQAPVTDHMREYAGRTHQDPNAPRLARDFQAATIDPAALPVRVEAHRGVAGVSYRIVGILWGGRSREHTLSIRFNPDREFAPVEDVIAGSERTWTLWSHTFQARSPGRYRLELAVKGPGVRTRRLDTGFYAREIDIPRV